MRRGEIAISVIVLIALGLLVLVILGSLLVGSFERAGQTTSDCQSTYSGVCKATNDCLASKGKIVRGISCDEEIRYDAGNDWEIYSFPEGGAVCCVIR